MGGSLLWHTVHQARRRSSSRNERSRAACLFNRTSLERAAAAVAFRKLGQLIQYHTTTVILSYDKDMNMITHFLYYYHTVRSRVCQDTINMTPTMMVLSRALYVLSRHNKAQGAPGVSLWLLYRMPPFHDSRSVRGCGAMTPSVEDSRRGHVEVQRVYADI